MYFINEEAEASPGHTREQGPGVRDIKVQAPRVWVFRRL